MIIVASRCRGTTHVAVPLLLKANYYTVGSVSRKRPFKTGPFFGSIFRQQYYSGPPSYRQSSRFY